jgi:hypothetical protein
MTYSATAVHNLSASEMAGATDEQVNDIGTASFVSRGENVLFIGDGSGKVYMASAIAQAASALGHSVARLGTPSSWPHDDLLEARHHAFTGWDREPRAHRSALLGSDLLVVDEAERWLEAAPLVTLMLLCMRAEQGKSTILVANNTAWHTMLDEGRFSRALQADNFNESSLLSELVDSEWLRFIKRSYGALMARRELLSSLGLDVVATAPHLQRSPSRFGRNFGWHVVHTGEINRLQYLRLNF